MKIIFKKFNKWLLKLKDKGFIGEEIATLYLIDKGYTIIERNFKCVIGEIDIIAKKDGFLCFIEVKRQISNDFKAENHFDYKKKKKLEKLIEIYLKKNKTKLPPRLELVAINEEKSQKNINHYIGL